MRKYRNQILLGLALALAIYIVLVLFLDNSGQLDQSMGPLLRRFSVALLLLCVLTQVSAGFFRFLEWHYYLGVIEARDKISLKDSLIIFVASFTFVVSPGKAGELLKSLLLKLRTEVPVARSAPVVVAERIVDGLAVILILLLTLLFSDEQLQLGEYRAVSQTVIFASAGLIGFGLVAVQIKPLAYFCLDIVKHTPLLWRLHHPLLEFYESSREIFKLKHIALTTIMGVGVYLSTSVGFLIVLYGFGLQISGILILQAMFIVGAVSAIGALSFVPNGAGVSEISNTLMLTIIVAPSNPEMTPAVAAAASLIQGFFHKWFRVLVGMLVAVIYRERLFPPEIEAEIADVRTDIGAAPNQPVTLEG